MYGVAVTKKILWLVFDLIDFMILLEQQSLSKILTIGGLLMTRQSI
jgi:hypothetical protein